MTDILERFEARFVPEPNTGCWLWDHTHIHRQGYGLITYRGKELKAHRVSWQLYRGAIPVRMCVCHKCDVPSCVNPEHLFIGTQRDNVADMMSKGRGRSWPSAAGEANNHSRATESLVRNIRRLCANGYRQIDVSKQTGLSPMTISRIVTRKAWNHVLD